MGGVAGVGDRDLAGDIIKTLGFPGAMQALLFAALPPDACTAHYPSLCLFPAFYYAIVAWSL